MTDAEVGHMTEKVVIPPPERVETFPRRKPTVPPDEYLPYEPDDDLVPPMANAGEGYRFHITGLTHDERGYPGMDAETQERLITRLVEKIRKNKDDIIQLEEEGLENAEVVVCSYGISARTALWPVELARREGIKVGTLRLITVWPFPEERIRQLARKVKGFVVPELNFGQIVLEVERCAAGQAEVILVPHAGGGIHDPEKVLEAIRRAANGNR